MKGDVRGRWRDGKRGRKRCRQKEKHLQPALPPHHSLGNKGLWKCINAGERETDRQGGGGEKEKGERKRERERANKRGRETERCYWLTVITSSVIEIFLSQSKK